LLVSRLQKIKEILTIIFGDPLDVAEASSLGAALLLPEVLVVVGTVLDVARVVAHTVADAVFAPVFGPGVVAVALRLLYSAAAGARTNAETDE